MKKRILYAAWAVIYILCVALGLIREPVGFGKALLVCVAVLFFLPGALLLYDGIRGGDRKAVLLVRGLAIASLSLTIIALAANIVSIGASTAVGDALYEVLDLVSAPMLCGQYWLLSMFLWACLLTGSFLKKPE